MVAARKTKTTRSRSTAKKKPARTTRKTAAKKPARKATARKKTVAKKPARRAAASRTKAKSRTTRARTSARAKASSESYLKYSGKFTVRLPKSLHQALVERAEKEGVSLNLFVTNALSSKVASPSRKR